MRINENALRGLIKRLISESWEDLPEHEHDTTLVLGVERGEILDGTGVPGFPRIIASRDFEDWDALELDQSVPAGVMAFIQKFGGAVVDARGESGPGGGPIKIYTPNGVYPMDRDALYSAEDDLSNHYESGTVQQCRYLKMGIVGSMSDSGKVVQITKMPGSF